MTRQRVPKKTGAEEKPGGTTNPGGTKETAADKKPNGRRERKKAYRRRRRPTVYDDSYSEGRLAKLADCFAEDRNIGAPPLHSSGHVRTTFFVNVEWTVDGPDKEGSVVGQAYVECLEPLRRVHPYPIVLIHGDYHTGQMTKPDGYPGWAAYFLGKGYTVYVIDLPPVGRSNFFSSTHYKICDMGLTSHSLSASFVETELTCSETARPGDDENFLVSSRAKFHDQWPGTGLRGDPIFSNYMASLVTLNLSKLERQTLGQSAMQSLMKRIGKAILIGEGTGGTIAWLTADVEPDLVAGVVAVEPAGPPFGTAAIKEGHRKYYTPYVKRKEGYRIWGLADIPLTYDPALPSPAELVNRAWQSPLDIASFGRTDGEGTCFLQSKIELDDFAIPQAIEEDTDPNIPPLQVRQLVNLKKMPQVLVTAHASSHMAYDWATVSFMKQAGVDVDWIKLEDYYLWGNGHLMFLEQNSNEIAQLIESYLRNFVEPQEYFVLAPELEVIQQSIERDLSQQEAIEDAQQRTPEQDELRLLNYQTPDRQHRPFPDAHLSRQPHQDIRFDSAPSQNTNQPKRRDTQPRIVQTAHKEEGEEYISDEIHVAYSPPPLPTPEPVLPTQKQYVRISDVLRKKPKYETQPRSWGMDGAGDDPDEEEAPKHELAESEIDPDGPLSKQKKEGTEKERQEKDTIQWPKAPEPKVDRCAGGLPDFRQWIPGAVDPSEWDEQDSRRDDFLRRDAWDWEGRPGGVEILTLNARTAAREKRRLARWRSRQRGMTPADWRVYDHEYRLERKKVKEDLAKEARGEGKPKEERKPWEGHASDFDMDMAMGYLPGRPEPHLAEYLAVREEMWFRMSVNNDNLRESHESFLNIWKERRETARRQSFRPRQPAPLPSHGSVLRPAFQQVIQEAPQPAVQIGPQPVPRPSITGIHTAQPTPIRQLNPQQNSHQSGCRLNPFQLNQRKMQHDQVQALQVEQLRAQQMLQQQYQAQLHTLQLQHLQQMQMWQRQGLQYMMQQQQQPRQFQAVMPQQRQRQPEIFELPGDTPRTNALTNRQEQQPQPRPGGALHGLPGITGAPFLPGQGLARKFSQQQQQQQQQQVVSGLKRKREAASEVAAAEEEDAAAAIEGVKEEEEGVKEEKVKEEGGKKTKGLECSIFG